MRGQVPGAAGAKRAITQQAKQVVYTAAKQTGAPVAAPKPQETAQAPEPVQAGAQAPPPLPPKPAPFDAAAYKEEVDQISARRLSELREKIKQIQEEQMRGGDQAQVQAEQQAAQQVEEAPAAVKSKRGTGEAGKRSRKG